MSSKQLQDFNLQGLHRWLKAQSADLVLRPGHIYGCLLARFGQQYFGPETYAGPEWGGDQWSLRIKPPSVFEDPIEICAPWLSKVGTWFDSLFPSSIRASELLPLFEREFWSELGLPNDSGAPS